MRACTGKDWQRSNKDGCNSLLGARVERLVPCGTLRLSSVVCQWRLHFFGTCYNTLPFSIATQLRSFRVRAHLELDKHRDV